MFLIGPHVYALATTCRARKIGHEGQDTLIIVLSTYGV